MINYQYQSILPSPFTIHSRNHQRVCPVVVMVPLVQCNRHEQLDAEMLEDRVVELRSAVYDLQVTVGWVGDGGLGCARYEKWSCSCMETIGSFVHDGL